MDAFENQPVPQEPTPQQTPTQPERPAAGQNGQPVHRRVTVRPAQPGSHPTQQPVQHAPQQPVQTYSQPVRRESPFADSPYVLQQPPEAPKPRKKKERKVLKAIVSAVLILALVAGSCGITAAVVNEKWENEFQKNNAALQAQLTEMDARVEAAMEEAVQASGGLTEATGGMTPAQVYVRNIDAVVAVTAVSSSGTSTGSGFIISEDGYIVTNHHVIDGGDGLSITTDSGESFTATLVGSDSINDLAVLKAEGKFQPAALGSSDELIVGDQVVAIGNPLGSLTSTLTVGYISGKDRDVNTSGMAINMIQTDAAINSGNSGGPLFNMAGEVVGITTAKYSGTSSSGASIEGVGFAIPIDDVKDMIEDLMRNGYISGAYLGVMVSDMDSAVAQAYGLPMGAYVQDVTPGSCAQKAGMLNKDIIIAVGEYEVESVGDLSRALRHFDGGDTTTVTVYRSGAERVLTITLDEKPAEE